ncbi:hypothetical protein HF690_10860 [Oleiagrimonas citrea]|uniref:Uncharacterized protein n=1 Tax=Oleiagrimonas citrea TaxID=1665687 RepID=A0A846ZP61_9GAMM|nr:hypothetical protein [Oleiagrimonas citrea]NKZ39447.1 hypothetical protein [Oleiagrimonas citrea]
MHVAVMAFHVPQRDHGAVELDHQFLAGLDVVAVRRDAANLQRAACGLRSTGEYHEKRQGRADQRFASMAFHAQSPLNESLMHAGLLTMWNFDYPPFTRQAESGDVRYPDIEHCGAVFRLATA